MEAEVTRRARTLAILLSRLVLGGVFVYASLDKIIHPDRFAEVVYNYRLLPTGAVNILALTLPWVELAAGALLVFGVFFLPSASILTGLIAVFIMAIGVNLIRGVDFTCGCFTTSPETVRAGVTTLVRDIILLVPAGLCIREGLRRARQ